MRLICPNCSAQYEVDGSLIPDEGREVQCSNCGHNWFELPASDAGTAPPPPEVEPEETDDEGVNTSTDEPFEELEEQVVKESEASAVDDPAWDWPEDEETVAPPPQGGSDRPRRPADLAALEILKEEADRELAKRRDEVVEPLETQQDLALEEVRDRETPSRALRARMARLRGEEDEDVEEEVAEEENSTPEEEAYSAPRRDLLPDIDEINSSLRPAGLAAGQRTEAEEAEHRRGFRTGFIGVVTITVLMIVAYAQAPAIAGVLPGTEAALIDYVDWANRVRDSLNALLGG